MVLVRSSNPKAAKRPDHLVPTRVCDVRMNIDFHNGAREAGHLGVIDNQNARSEMEASTLAL